MGDTIGLHQALTPAEIVRALDRDVVGQQAAKRAVAVAIRNRWRRLQLGASAAASVSPHNVLLIGPTGVGKTEIARCVASLTGAPFAKVEATRYTEVGYIGRDVSAMVQDLVDAALVLVERESRSNARSAAQKRARDLLVDILLRSGGAGVAQTRASIEQALARGALDGVEVRLPEAGARESLRAGREEDAGLGGRLSELLATRFGERLTVRRALEKLAAEYESRGLDVEWMEQQAVVRAAESGIIFVDEIDKLIGVSSQQGPDVSRGGVQRDLLPVVEGCRVETTLGVVDTTHVLFIAAGAFHRHTPSELMPELQGRFPVRVELTPLQRADYRAILARGTGGLLSQHIDMLGVEGLEVAVSDDALDELARIADEANRRLDDIGARRLHTVLERVFEELSFVAPDLRDRRLNIDRAYVNERMQGVLEDEDLLRYIL